MDFMKFKLAVASQFERMSASGRLLRVEHDPNVLWEKYLDSFPAGTNQIYHKCREYDCGCCKQFIRTIGGVIIIKAGHISTIWDIEGLEPEFQLVADTLADFVRSKSIDGLFLHYDRAVGTDKSFEQVAGMNPVRWEHFFVHLPAYAVTSKPNIGPATGEARATYDVMYRGLNEISHEAVNTVLELISQNSLYRGEEHKFALTEFRKLQHEAINKQLSVFVWERSHTITASVSRIRNTSIGTLLVDLSEGVDLEQAVKSFEAKVAPTNYKRPTALVTASMIADAKAKVESLGLTSALERRYATLGDINVNNILFADRETKKSIEGSVFDDIQSTAVSAPKLDKIEQVPIDKFLADILPKATSIDVMVENRLISNFVSLIAPVDPTAGKLFKWDNRFSWSYNGEVADSIKERVKQAGGRVEGDLCCRLAWNNTDDLDFHMMEPNNHEIYYVNRQRLSPSGGILDVDANGADGIRIDPVENIVYSNMYKMRPGIYKLMVNMFSKRNTANGGFEVEIEAGGQTIIMAHPATMRQGDFVHIADIRFDGIKLHVEPKLTSTQTSRVMWGLTTQQFHPASVIMSSPNYWDGQGVGNRHWFFMLDSCVNDGKARGFYNEFLSPALDAHRKVLELVGSKTQVKDSPHQLSGLGFSSTQRNNLLCRVKGSFTRTINVIF